MTAVQEIQAAIEKLTELRSVGVMYPDQYPTDTAAEFRAACGLITTLHRTIDAQLAILRECRDQAERVEAFPEYWYMPVSDQMRALVRAINEVTP